MTLIDELKRRHQELRQKMDELEAQENVIANDLLDLNIAIEALEGPPVATLEQAPAQPVHPGELRDAPPAASEESGDHIPQTIATLNAMDNPDRVSDDFTLLDPAVLRDEPEIPKGFTRWEGGKCPVPFGSEYEWLERSGETYTDTHDEEGNLWRWVHNGGQDDLIAYRIITPEAEPEPEGYAPVVDAEPVLDATELAQVTIDKVPPTAEVIKDQTGRAKFALFGGQTHEVVEPSNTEADFWARVLHPRKREEA